MRAYSSPRPAVGQIRSLQNHPHILDAALEVQVPFAVMTNASSTNRHPSNLTAPALESALYRTAIRN